MSAESGSDGGVARSAWFHGTSLDRKGSMQRLLYQPDGAFLVRSSASRAGCFSLDLIVEGGRFLPLLITPDTSAGADGVALQAAEQHGVRGGVYPSLQALVQANAAVLRHPVPPGATPVAPGAAAASAVAADDPADVGGYDSLDAEPAPMGAAQRVLEEVTVRGIGSHGGSAGRAEHEGIDAGEMLMRGGKGGSSGSPGDGGGEGMDEGERLMGMTNVET